MRFLGSLAVALSMYSKIPVPTVDWNEKNMKYAMCFFPAAGVVTGALEYAAGYALLTWTDCGSLFFGENTLPILTAWGLILFLLFCAAALLLFNVYQLRTKPRNILLYNLCLFCITVGIYFFPGSTAITPALAAPAIATLLPVVLTRINGIAASIFYLVILLLSLLPGLI